MKDGHRFTQRPAKRRAWCSCGKFFNGLSWLEQAKAHLEEL